MDDVKPDWVDEAGGEDGPPMPSEAEMRASLLRSRQQIAEGRTVPLSDVMTELDAVIARMEARRRDRAE